MASPGDSAITVARDAMFADTAVEDDLDRLGSAFLIKRPRQIGADDARYRKLIQLLAFQPKQVLKIVYQLLEVLFGKQADIEALNLRPWRVFEVNVNEIIVEIPLDLTAASNANASYLHGLGGDANGYTEVSAIELLVPGEDFRIAASSFATLLLDVFDSSGVLIGSFPIVSVDYDTTTKINKFTIVGLLPTTTVGLTWRVLVPDVVSWRGDYLLPDATRPGSEVLGHIVVFFGEGLIELFEEFMALIVKASGIKIRIERI